MKTLFFRVNLCFALLISFSLPSCADEPSGIKFFTGSWNDVLAEAKRQNKPVFVDIFTTWCGPCKLMAKQAFPDPKVGEKFNANFISYQIDAEKGEGVAVAKKYAVDAYPTSLYVAANGDLIHRAIGYGGIKGMLEEANKAIEAVRDPNPLSAMEKQYESGKREPEFLAGYLQKRAKVGMPNSDALDAYLKTVPESEWSSDKNLAVIGGNLTTATSPAFSVIAKEAPKLRMDPTKRQQAQAVFSGLFRSIEADFKKAVINKSEAELEANITKRQELNALMQPMGMMAPQEAEANGYRMRFYQQTKNADKYQVLAAAEATKLMSVPMDSVKARNELAYKNFQKQTAMMPDSVKNRDDFKKYAESMKTGETKQMAMKLNNLAWGYYETITDPKALNQALTWSAKSLEYDRAGMYLDTYAHLLSKLGRKDEAIKTQQEAIAKEKAAGGDVANYEKELDLMKKK